MISHSSYTNYLIFYARLQKLSSLDRMGCHSDFCFDASLEDFFPILSVGGTLDIMPEEIRMDIPAIKEYIDHRGINCISFTTSLGSLILQEYPDVHLRYMVVGGEKLKPVDDLRIPLWNFYGPTECTVSCVIALIEPFRKYIEVPIGKTVANSTALVLDKDGKMLPEGVEGELYISGPQLSVGYWHNPELTFEKFVDCPYVSGQKMYKTGDLVRWNEEGQLEYIGRIDNQVKLRGFRIELGEIEAVCSKIAGVRQSVALVKNDVLCLYYVGAVQESLIRDELSKSLTDYMVPSVFVRMESMPFTPNGKIDRKVLPGPAISPKEYVAPETINEKMMCKIVAEELHIEQIGVTDSFKSYGMSSLTTMKLNLRLRKCGYHVTMERIYKADCVKILCTYVNDSIKDSEVGFWMMPFDPAKQIVVLCCGVIGSELLISKITAWTDVYNIYILQPIFSSWTDIEQISYKEILSRYFSLLTRDIKGEIYSMVGFSFGGELAYHLVSMWSDYSGQQPTVLMGDTYIIRCEIELPNFNFSNHVEEYHYKLQREFFNHLGQLPLTSYKGRTILISATDNSLSVGVNEQRWMQIKRDIIINRIPDTHDGLYSNEEYFSYYLLLITNS